MFLTAFEYRLMFLWKAHVVIVHTTLMGTCCVEIISQYMADLLGFVTGNQLFKFVMACFYRVFLHVRISTIKMLGFTLYYIFMNNSINLCHNKKPWCTHICEPQKISPYETEMCDRLWIMHCNNFC